ncbi:alpha/beta hydrolase family protein [Curtobacterium flaccumfaciens]|uniref:Alpha/beta hydrolase family protein n=1 Tax=Curtobacterium flaccumfaciens TaxID=2035 RepID=A0A4R6DKY6_9MICO|nr:alpha/beta hydrolase [Curtobacterium flaccumfaciens]TDN45373.1 alpha/beta hydrolase family protein [Curtobacterium flaccumfaciens]
MNRALRWTAWVVAVIVLLAVVFLVWANIVMQGTRSAALQVWRDDRVSVRDAGDSVVMAPTGDANGVGIVFIPGAKVDPYAYMATFRQVVASGTTVVITKPTLHLAFFDTRGLSTFEAHAPSVATWAVGGHSLGGVRACQLAPDADGLLLLGSYCANDISRSYIDVLSVSGSRDGLSTPAKVDAARHLLPSTATMTEVTGANHADFGAYGDQPGDRTATISRAEARAQIGDAVEEWVRGLR